MAPHRNFVVIGMMPGTSRGVNMRPSQLPSIPGRLIMSGCGHKTAFIRDMINKMSAIAPHPTEAHGQDGHAIEAQGFAFIAVRKLRRRPMTLPATIRQGEPMIGAAFHRSLSLGERAAA